MIPSLLLSLAVGSPTCPVVPLTTPRSWTYRVRVSWTEAGASVPHDSAITWTTRVLDLRTRDSVAVALVRDWPTALAFWEPGQPPDTTLIVCIGTQLFQVSADGRLRGAVADSLLAGTLHPAISDLILQLPLHRGDLYGRERSERQDTDYAWYVESVAPVTERSIRLGAHRSDSVYTVAYRTLPDQQIQEFVPGFGLTRYAYAHHGTAATASALLVATRRPP